MSAVPKNIKAADWRLSQIAEAHNELDKAYFASDEYKNYESFYKLKEAIDWIMEQGKVSSILDVGCGSGWHAVYLQKEGIVPPLSYTGFDLSPRMCELASQNFPDGEFCELDICKQSVSPIYDIVMESAVLELVHDWRAALSNMLKSCHMWFVSHRLFVKEDKTFAEQVQTYHNIPDVRFHIGMDDFKEILEQENFELVRSDLWRTGAYNMGTYVCRSVQ
jgi:SAM-dependent methyltransferase